MSGKASGSLPLRCTSGASALHAQAAALAAQRLPMHERQARKCAPRAIEAAPARAVLQGAASAVDLAEIGLEVLKARYLWGKCGHARLNNALAMADALLGRTPIEVPLTPANSEAGGPNE